MGGGIFYVWRDAFTLAVGKWFSVSWTYPSTSLCIIRQLLVKNADSAARKFEIWSYRGSIKDQHALVTVPAGEVRDLALATGGGLQSRAQPIMNIGDGVNPVFFLKVQQATVTEHLLVIRSIMEVVRGSEQVLDSPVREIL